MALILGTYIGYYTNWFIHYMIVIYGWIPIFVLDILLVILFELITFKME